MKPMTFVSEGRKKISFYSSGWSRKNILPTLCFCLCGLSIFYTLLDTRLARECFFVACYGAITGIILDWRNSASYLKPLPLALLAIGVSKVIWFAAFYTNNPDMDLGNSYLQVGKRLILASILIAYLLKKQNLIILKSELIALAISITFIATSLFGTYQVIQGIDRISFMNTRATDAAYMYSCISLSLIVYLLKKHSFKEYILAFIVFFISLFLIMETGTRSALIFHPIIFIIVFTVGCHAKQRRLIFGLSILAIISTFIVFKPHIDARIKQTQDEFSLYSSSQGNEASSLGTRLAMWQTGWAVFKEHPWGMSLEQRYKAMSDYVMLKQSGESALIYADIHLHDDSIETMTQQGILGLILLWYFYVSTFVKAFSEKNRLLLTVLLCMGAYGLTDVVFISREQTIYFSVMLLVAYMLSPKPKVNEISH